MYSNKLRVARRLRRKRGIRKRVSGTRSRPRLTVFRSLHHMYAQVIDDERGVTICEASTRSKSLVGQVSSGGNVAAAKLVGAALAARAREADVEQVCLDRSGYRYHGRLKALCDAAREGGLRF